MFVTLIRRVVPRPVRNALRRPTTSLRRLKAKARYMFGICDVAAPRPGWVIRCHPLCPEQFSVFCKDPEQAVELEDFISFCTAGMKFLDVGAHWGFFSLAAARFGGSEVRGLAIEASPAAAGVCRRNLALNGLGKVVTVITAAAGAQAGELEMLTTGAGGADYFVVPDESRPDTIRVPQITMDATCRQYAFEPTHIKIDVEGWEGEVLDGAEELIRKCKPTIFLELHGSILEKRGQDPRAVLAKLKRLGYGEFVQMGKPLKTSELEERHFNARFVCLPDKVLPAS